MMKSQQSLLKKEEFFKLKDFFFSEKCAWHFRKHQTANDDSFFAHTIFLQFQPCSPIWEDIQPLIRKLDIKPEQLINIRANLVLRKPEHKYSNFHIDCQSNKPFTTAIFYMNTCNGGTVFQDKTEIQSEENKAIIFDGNTEHKAKSQTDTDRRIVINFNWRNK